jgi:methionine aminotransferase
MKSIASKLTGTTTTIFTVMSALAAEHGAINLSQGFPDYPVDPILKNLVNEAILADHNQYAPMAGVPALRQRIAGKIAQTCGRTTDPDLEVTITTGASQAIASAITALISQGDEVIVLEPAYDSYIPSVKVNGGIVRSYEMRGPDFRVDWDAVEAMVGNKTKLLIINNPHNPTGTCFTSHDLDQIEKIVLRHGLILLSDEVYEHLVYDGQLHHSILSRPALADQSMVAFSFGKTFHATGWKVGYLIASPDLTREFRKIHQFTVFSVNTPVQHALARYMENPESWQNLPAFFQAKRDLLQAGMANTAFKPLPSEGTYFQLYDYQAISDLKDTEFAVWLTKTHGVATIPLSPFYQSGLDQKLVRICFAKKPETIIAATERLSAMAH